VTAGRSPWWPLNWPLILAIHAYRWTLSPLIGGHCRFSPTCSAYGLEVCRRFSPPVAVWLIVRRLGRCHPFGGSGVDEPPAYRPRTDVQGSGPG